MRKLLAVLFCLFSASSFADSIYVTPSFFGFNIASCLPTKPTDPTDSCYNWTNLDGYRPRPDCSPTSDDITTRPSGIEA